MRNTNPALCGCACTRVKCGRITTLYTLLCMYEGRNETHHPHVTSGHPHMRAYTHMYVHRENEYVLMRCKYGSKCTQSKGASRDAHSVWGWKCSGSAPSPSPAWGGKGEECPCSWHMLHIQTWLFAFPLQDIFCGRADSMSTGKVLNESNPISQMPYQLQTGLFLTADLSHHTLLKNPYTTNN